MRKLKLTIFGVITIYIHYQFESIMISLLTSVIFTSRLPDKPIFYNYTGAKTVETLSPRFIILMFVVCWYGSVARQYVMYLPGPRILWT